MKIKTRLKINVWFSLVLTLLIILSLGWSFLAVYQAERNVRLVDQMERNVFERIVLRDDWILHREDRAIAQWNAKTKTLSGLFDSAFRAFTNKEDKDVLRNARDDFEATVGIFSGVIEKYKRKERAEQGKPDFTETESRLLGQVFLKAYSLNDNIRRLSEHLRKAEIAERNRLVALIVIFVFGGVIAMVFNSVLLNKIVAKEVASITEGMWIMGDGNLDYHIDVPGDDELSYLARASNDMAARLKQSYVSIDKMRQEIAERKRAEENFKTLTFHQQSLIAAIPDIIMEVDADKRYTWANGPGIEFFGDDVLGKEAALYFVRGQNTYDKVQPIFNGDEEIIYVESWQRRKDGQERLLAWWCRVLKDTQGNVTGALSSARDITESRISEEKIRESEDKFRYMFDNSMVGKSITFPDGRVNVNKAFSEMLGYSQDEINQGRWQDITHPDDVEMTQREINRILSGEKDSTRFIKRFVHMNGSVIWTDLSSSARRDKDGKPVYLLTTIINITDRKQAEEEILKLNINLEQRVAERTAELSAKTEELERINRVFVERELRMRELKTKIAELEKKLLRL
jgi:PAS domain S-box-containing protein